jgi:hypothetical protein
MSLREIYSGKHIPPGNKDTDFPEYEIKKILPEQVTVPENSLRQAHPAQENLSHQPPSPCPIAALPVQV